MSRQRSLVIFLIILAIMLSGAFTIYSFVVEIDKKQLPVIGQVQPFELVDQTNSPFTMENLKGKIWIANFFFTTCSDICPVMSKNMANLNRTFEGLEDIRLVSISVNPENDSAEILARYAQKYDARDNWFFLTGRRETITELAAGSFKLGAIDEPVFHSAHFSLVDRHGLIRGYYDGTQKSEIDRLYKDAAHLLSLNKKLRG